MSFKLTPTAARKLLAMGLLSTVIPTIINDFLPIPDFFRGAMLGLGLGLEIIGIILLRKSGASSCGTSGSEAKIEN